MEMSKFGTRVALPVTELPEATGIDARVWAEAIKRGDLPVVSVSPRRRVVLIADLEAYLAARRTNA